MNTKLMALMEKLLPLIVRRISDDLKNEIFKAVLQIQKFAREKPGNSFDFFFAELLKEILNIHFPAIEKEITELPDLPDMSQYREPEKEIPDSSESDKDPKTGKKK